ncbi:BspA family leucine-rich repeat surface protein, partial [Enterococcus moraviensis]
MSTMFWATYKLNELNVSKWNTSQVLTMASMFAFTNELEVLDTSSWDTGKVTSMKSMFHYAKQLKSIDTSGWNTSSVTDMSDMFEKTEQLKNIDVSKWDTSKVKTMSRMFDSSGITEIDVSEWNTSKVTNMYRLFGDTSLKKLDLSSWEMAAVRDTDRIFPKYLEELTLAKEFRFKGDTGLTENTKAPYSGRWIHKNEGTSPAVIQSTTKEFTQNYDGSYSGTYIREKDSATFWTVPWTWDDVTQTVEFGSGEFPETNAKYNIRTHIESQKRLDGKKIKKIVFTKPVKLGKNASYLFSELSKLESIEGGNYLNTV